MFPANAWSRAGPNDLAGFTDVPVNAKPNKWTSVNTNPITIPACFPSWWFLSVTPKIEITKIKVNTVSIPKAQIYDTKSGLPYIGTSPSSTGRRVFWISFPPNEVKFPLKNNPNNKAPIVAPINWLNT